LHWAGNATGSLLRAIASVLRKSFEFHKVTFPDRGISGRRKKNL
jgi:hypothetical protein